MLAVVFACSQFKDYIPGNRQVTVETDHQPLVSIFKKPLNSAPARLQRMLLQLQHYDLNIIYKKGKDLVIADTLSRAYIPECALSEMESDDIQVLSVISISENKYKELQTASMSDPIIKKTIELCQVGWPKNNSSLTDNVKGYFSFRDELGPEDGILYRGQRIVVPNSLRQEYLTLLHQGHMGIEGTRRRAKEMLYWPNMNEDIEMHISNCEPCQQVRNHQPKAPISNYPVPSRPFAVVATDLFEWRNKTYLATVDSYSNWIEIDLLNTTTSAAVINKLKAHFARFGVPVQLISDNGPQFSSKEFKTFTETWDIEHITSSPKHARANGLAERAVQSAKKLMEKTRKEGGDIYMGLLNMRNTPRPNLGSQCQRNLARRTRTPIPIAESLLRPELLDSEVIQYNISEQRAKQASHASAHTKQLSPLQMGDKARMEEGKGYGRLVTVLGQGASPNSHQVQDADGNIYRRTREHLLKVQQTPAAPATLSNNINLSTPPDQLNNTTVTQAGRRVKKPGNNPTNPYHYY